MIGTYSTSNVVPLARNARQEDGRHSAQSGQSVPTAMDVRPQHVQRCMRVWRPLQMTAGIAYPLCILTVDSAAAKRMTVKRLHFMLAAGHAVKQRS